MSRPIRVVVLSALALVAASCTAEKKKLGPDTGLSTACDPLVPGTSDRPICGFPFPSSVYEKPDTTKPTGRHIVFQADGLPDVSGAPIDPSAWLDSDGFSPGQGPMTVIEGATATGLVSQNNIAASVDTATSATLLFEDPNEADPNAALIPVPHFSEVDVNGEATESSYDRIFMIRPVVRLKDNTRYIVAIRNVKDAAGAVIAPSPAFKGIVDGTGYQGREALYTSPSGPTVGIFTKLAAKGVSKANLQLAWDYHTASKENNTSQLVDMRDRALAALPAGGPEFTISYSSDNPDALTGRRIFGKIKVPLFLDSGSVPKSPDDVTTGYTLQRDGDGRPKVNGFADFDFIVNVPKSVFDDTAAAPILLQGHGLFSDRAEGQNANSNSYNYLLKLANEHKYVTVTVDMPGWRNAETYNGWPADWAAAFPDAKDANDERDEDKAVGFISAPANKFRGMIDRGTQGILNELIAMKMMETSLANDAHLKAGDGHKFIDTTKSFYRGDSQGGILGITFMALSQTVTRGYLGEAGFPYNLLLTRSTGFTNFLGLLQLGYGGNIRTQLVLGLMQMFWDRFEGNGFAPYITTNLLPNTPSHTVLVNSGIGDYLVTPISSHILARAIGAKVLKPTLQSPLYSSAVSDGAKFPLYGLDEVDGPVTGNALQEYDFGVLTQTGVTVFDTNKPPDGNGRYDPHDKIRQLEAVRTATHTFLSTGRAENHCGADGTPAACVFQCNADGDNCVVK